MLITDVATTLVEFPFDAPFHPAWARGRNMPALQMVLIQVETDEGITGIGAAHAGPEAMISIDRFVKPYFVGEDPFAVERLTAVLRDAEILGPPLYCMEIPLWDIVGKQAGLPMYRLWGGYTSRPKVYCATAEVRSAEQRVDDVHRLIDEGFTAVKLRFHRPDPFEDLAVVEAVRNAVGDRVEIMIDGNQAGVEPGHGGHETWGYKRALDIARELERMGCYWLEEPLPRHDYDDLARLRDRLEKLRIAGGEDNHGLHEFRLLLERNCYDVLTPDALLSEGVFQLRKVAALAEAHFCEFAPHTWGNGIGLLANLHMAASTPNCTYVEFPHDPPSGWTASSRDQMLMETLHVDPDGCVTMPEQPGFGFILDGEAIERHTVATPLDR
jgi:L-alanine-DL-glutamate epimerase-like enolase superfamily enzyme